MHDSQAMRADTPHDYWQIVMTHEAGHAVAALAIYGVSAEIVIKARSGESAPFGASYTHKISLMDAASDEGDALGAIIVMAAGAKAEAICLGITESAGFAGDRAKIVAIQTDWERKCNDEYPRSLVLPEDVIKQVLAGNPQRRAKLSEIDEEIASDFERTGTIISENRRALEAIAAEACNRIRSLGDHNLSDGRTVLSAKRIEEIWLRERGGQ